MSTSVLDLIGKQLNSPLPLPPPQHVPGITGTFSLEIKTREMRADPAFPLTL